MKPEEIAELGEDDKFILAVTWSDFIKVEKDNPLDEGRLKLLVGKYSR